MMKPVPLVVSLLLVPLLTGCIGGGGDVRDPAEGCLSPLDTEGTRYVPTDHDPLANRTNDESAWDFEQRNLRTCSLGAIGWDPLAPDGTPHRYIGEIDMRGDLDLGTVAVLGNGEGARVYLLDISDRADPEVISYIDQENTYIVDVKISDDGAYLFTASQTIPLDPELSHLPRLDGPQGFSVYDIRDPTAPRFVTTTVDTGYGCHMLSHQVIGEQEVLFCISQHVRAYRLERTDAGLVSAGFVDYVASDDTGTPRPGGPAVPIAIPDDARPVTGEVFGRFTSRPHDVTVQEDAVDGRTYATVSHWNGGVRIVDVTDFPTMTEVGKWQGEGATHYDGNVHTAMMFHIGDDRYLVASPEYTYGGQVPSLWVIDANDLTDLRLVGEWSHPGGHESQGLFMTTHQWQVAPTGPDANLSETQIYLTFNHGGIWVLGFEEILAGDDQAAILGFNLARHEIDPDGAVSNAVLATWDVNVVDGHIYGSDRATGLWVFHLQDDPLGDPRYSGFA